MHEELIAIQRKRAPIAAPLPKGNLKPLAKAGCPSGRATLLRDSVRFLHRVQRR